MPGDNHQRSDRDVRDLLASAPLPPVSIDTASVIRRSRMRRLPRQLGVGAAVTLAVAGIGVAAVTGLRPPQQSMVTGASDQARTDQSGAEQSGAEQSESNQPGGQTPLEAASGGTMLAPVEKLNPCGGPVTPVEASETGLVLTPHFPASAPATGAPVAGTVTLSNTGDRRVVGTTAAAPAITVAQGGVTVWHSNGPMIMMAVMVDLAPGESMDYQASLTPVLCAEEDETRESFRDDLPALAPGSFDLTAAIYLTPAGGEAPLLVTGPPASVTLG